MESNLPRVNNDEIITVFHMLKSRYYVVSALQHGQGVTVFTVEPNTALHQNEYIKICKVANVKIRPLDNVAVPEDIMNHPIAKSLVEKIGKPPVRQLYQYTFIPVSTRLIQRLEAGAEFYEISDNVVGKPIVMHVAHIYYTAYVSRSGRVYSETPGGTKVYVMLKKGELKWPNVYVFRRGHRYDIGVKIPLDEEQFRQLISYLYTC